MNSTLVNDIRIAITHQDQDQFLIDVIKGLSSEPKYLESKYFYDAKGDKIFQQIMSCPEYYLTKCEMEIFSLQTKKLASTFTEKFSQFDVVELGAGDASKSIYLLQELINEQVDFTYYPVDISTNVINFLQRELPQKLPLLKLQGLNGEYFEMLKKVSTLSTKPKVVLFLGSNIGNIPLEESRDFCSSLRSYLKPGDMLLMGFDLKKDPNVILDAYNDSAGFTKQFNLNLLHRINKELGANFNADDFNHTPTYNPASGACKSYLTSRCAQTATINKHDFNFAKGERIYMEISQKYSVVQTDQLAIDCGFKPIHHFYDSKEWFLDAIWQCV